MVTIYISEWQKYSDQANYYIIINKVYSCQIVFLIYFNCNFCFQEFFIFKILEKKDNEVETQATEENDDDEEKKEGEEEEEIFDEDDLEEVYTLK